MLIVMRVLEEGDRHRPLLGGAVHFPGAELRVPQRQQRQRDQAAFRLARAQVLGHPVVIGLEAGEAQLLVGLLEEQLAAETAHDIAEAQARLDMVAGHVGEPRALLP